MIELHGGKVPDRIAGSGSKDLPVGSQIRQA